MLKLLADQIRVLVLLVTADIQARDETRREHPEADYGLGLREMVNNWYRDANIRNPELAQQINNIPWEHLQRANLDELQADLLGVLEQESSKDGDQPLINAVIDALGGIYGSNRFGPETLAALRRALLRPSEIEEFRKLSRGSFSCSSCNHRFQQSEVGIFQRGAHEELMMLCANCATPAAIACPSCAESAPLSEAGRRLFASERKVLTQCGCKDGKKKSKKEPAPAVVDHGQVFVNRGPAPEPPAAAGWREIAGHPPQPPMPANREARRQEAAMRVQWELARRAGAELGLGDIVANIANPFADDGPRGDR